MSKKIGLSDGEWKIMQQLWDVGPLTIMELVARLRQEKGWTKHTVISMLSRMEGKGVVCYKEAGRAKRYAPSVPYDTVAGQETERFLSKVYHGSVGMMMNAMAKSNSLNKEDIEELYGILKKAEGEIHGHHD